MSRVLIRNEWSIGEVMTALPKIVLAFLTAGFMSLAAPAGAQDLDTLKAKAQEVIAAIDEFGTKVRIVKCAHLMEPNAWYAEQVITKVTSFDIKKSDSLLTPFVLIVDVQAINVNNMTSAKHAKYKGFSGKKQCYGSREDALKYFTDDVVERSVINPARGEYGYDNGRFRLLRGNEVFMNIFVRYTPDIRDQIGPALAVITQ